MAKFCTKCGKPLKDGEVCDCTKEKEKKNKSTEEILEEEPKNEVVVTTKKENNNNSFNEMFNDILNIFKKFIKKPLTTVEENNKESNFNRAIVLVLLYGIAGAIFALTFVKEYIAKTMTTMIPSGFGQLMNQAQANIEIPYFKIFLFSLVGISATVFLASLVTYLISNKMLKSKINYKETLVMYALPTIAGTIIFLIAALFNFIDFKLSMATLSIGVLLVQYYLNVSATNKLDIDKNNVGYVIVSTCVITSFLICYVTGKLIQK